MDEKQKELFYKRCVGLVALAMVLIWAILIVALRQHLGALAISLIAAAIVVYVAFLVVSKNVEKSLWRVWDDPRFDRRHWQRRWPALVIGIALLLCYKWLVQLVVRYILTDPAQAGVAQVYVSLLLSVLLFAAALLSESRWRLRFHREWAEKKGKTPPSLKK